MTNLEEKLERTAKRLERGERPYPIANHDIVDLLLEAAKYVKAQEELLWREIL